VLHQLDRAPVRKSGAEALSRHSRLDPPERAQDAGEEDPPGVRFFGSQAVAFPVGFDIHDGIHTPVYQSLFSIEPVSKSASTYRGKPVDVVIDVRSRLEFFFGHLRGAICIPVQRIGTELPKRAGIARDARILVYCASGARSAAARTILTQAGYTRVIDGGAMSAVATQLR